jgi:hypothetical protein
VAKQNKLPKGHSQKQYFCSHDQQASGGDEYADDSRRCVGSYSGTTLIEPGVWTGHLWHYAISKPGAFHKGLRAYVYPGHDFSHGTGADQLRFTPAVSHS